MNALEIGLYNALATDNTLTNAITKGGIYNTVARQGTALPYVIFFWTGGGLENINPSELHNVVYVVKVVADDAHEAGTIQGYIKNALHLQTLTVAGYTNFYTACEDEIQLTETTREGTVLHHRGYVVRIRIDD